MTDGILLLIRHYYWSVLLLTIGFIVTDRSYFQDRKRKRSPGPDHYNRLFPDTKTLYEAQEYTGTRSKAHISGGGEDNPVPFPTPDLKASVFRPSDYKDLDQHIETGSLIIIHFIWNNTLICLPRKR